MADKSAVIIIVLIVVGLIIFLSNETELQGIFIVETPIVQLCQIQADCPILSKCETQKNLISCPNNLCDYSLTTPQCRNQILTYQETIPIEKEKFSELPSGTNSFFCLFNFGRSICRIGEMKLTATSPKYVCSLPSDSATIISTGDNDNCWETELSFNGNDFILNNNNKGNIGLGLTAEISMSASLNENRQLRDSWVMPTRITLPDDFLEIKSKDLGDKFVLKDSQEQVCFTITNKLFGMDGGYTLLSRNFALEGGVIVQDIRKELFLKGDTDICYDFRTDKLGTIEDTIGVFGKVSTDRDYILKSSVAGSERFLIVSKEVKTTIEPTEELEQVEEVIIEEEIEEEVISEIPIEEEKEEFPDSVKILFVIFGIFILLKLFKVF